MQKSGVYIIRCKPTREIYVGATKRDFKTRVGQHKSRLKDGRHYATLMQERWDEYGPDAFEFQFLKSFPREEVHAREQDAIRRLKPAFNLAQRAVGCPKGSSHQDAARFEIEGLVLTIAEIANISKLTVPTIRARIARGLSGSDLLKGKHGVKRKVYTRKS